MSEPTPVDVSFEPAGPADPAPPARKRHHTLIAVIVAVGLLAAVGGTAAAFVLYERSTATEYAFTVNVWLKSGIGDADRESVRSALSGVTGVRYESGEEAYKHFKEIYKDSPDLVESVQPDSLPESFWFQREGAEFDCRLIEPLRGHPAVDEVNIRGWSKEQVEKDLPPKEISCF